MALFHGKGLTCCAGNKTKEKMWGEFEIDCQRLWDILSTRVEDLQRSKKVVDQSILYEVVYCGIVNVEDTDCPE